MTYQKWIGILGWSTIATSVSAILFAYLFMQSAWLSGMWALLAGLLSGGGVIGGFLSVRGTFLSERSVRRFLAIAAVCGALSVVSGYAILYYGAHLSILHPLAALKIVIGFFAGRAAVELFLHFRLRKGIRIA